MESNSIRQNYSDHKPYWCKPWSIITFGMLVLIFSWRLFYSIIFTTILGLFVIVWWLVFLILAPNSYDMISEKE